MEQLRALANEPLPHVPMTREEQRELLAELDAAVAAAEHEGEGLFYHKGGYGTAPGSTNRGVRD
jgi:hypothetical protein